MIHFPSYELMICLFGSFCISVPHPPCEKTKSPHLLPCWNVHLYSTQSFFSFCIADSSDPPRSVVLPAESPLLRGQADRITSSFAPWCQSRNQGAEVPPSALAFLGIPRPDLTLCHASSALSKVLIFSPTRSFSLHNKNTRRLHS